MNKGLLTSLFFIVISANIITAQEKDSLAITYLDDGKHQLFYGKFNDAIALSKKALEIFKTSKNYGKISEAYNLLSKAYRSNSQLNEALLPAQEALKNSRAKGFENKIEEANALDNIGLVESEMGKLKSALDNFDSALLIRDKSVTRDSIGYTNSYFNIGVTFRKQGHYDKALEQFKKALNIKLEDTPQNKILIANINEAIGHVYYDLGEFDDALVSFEKTLVLAKEVYENENPYFGKVYNEIGVVYSIKEQLNESLKYYQKALSVSIANYGLDRHPQQAKLHYNIGTIYRKQNLKEKALFHTQKTLDMGIRAFGKKHPNLFFPYSQMGEIHADEKGIPYIEKALAICNAQQNKNELRISFLYDYLSVIYTNIGRYSEALTSAKEALKIRLKLFGEHNVNTIRSHNIVSKIHITLKDYEGALAHNKYALNFNYSRNKDKQILAKDFESTKHSDSDLLIEALKVRGDIFLAFYYEHLKKEDLKQSIDFYEKATDQINVLAKTKRNHDDKIKFSGIVKSVYAKNIETNLLLYKLDKNASSLEKSFYYSEKSRANVLRELTNSIEAKKSFDIDPDILELENAINENIAQLKTDVFEESSKKDTDSTKLYALEGKALDFIRKKDSLENTIEINYPKYFELKHEKNTIQISELQEKLDEQTTLIEFFKAEEITYAFIFTKTTFHVKQLSIVGLDQKIQAFNNSITNKDQSKYLQNAFTLYQDLIKPIKKHVVGDKLIIVPDESLWYLQFDLLVSEESSSTNTMPPYLLFDYAISYANSASVLFEKYIKNDRSDLLDECLAFSYTDSLTNDQQTISLTELRGSKADLPGTRKEILEISKQFDGQYFYGSNANELNFKKNANKYKLVHLALHGDIDNVNPENVKLYFSDIGKKNEEDNILFGHELYAENVSADLVVLSACNTGSGKMNKGEGILSLGNAFQYAGAKSLLLSRWEISDKTTPKIMKLFYENIKNGMTKGKALQRAKIDYLANSDAFSSGPFYWGSFYILGNVDAISFAKSSIEKWKIFLLVLVVLFLSVLAFKFLTPFRNQVFKIFRN